MKYLLIVFLFVGCHHANEAEEPTCPVDEQITVEKEVECEGEFCMTKDFQECFDNFPLDTCDEDGNLLYHTGKVLSDVYGVCFYEKYTKECSRGCMVAENENHDDKCAKPCELNPCETPLPPFCQASNILATYGPGSCAVNSDSQEQCSYMVSNRRMCNCVHSTEDREAHCFGDYEDEVN